MTSTIDRAGGAPGRGAGALRHTEPPREAETTRRSDVRRRAEERRAVRRGRLQAEHGVAATPSRPGPADYAQRVPFVVAVLLLIGTGVGGTLWLSAQSTEETYALKAARDENVHLVEQKEALLASNERARSAEVLAERAHKLGMVGVDTAPILVRGADGGIEIVGPSEAALGAPIEPLQPAPVPSGTSTPHTGGFAVPPAQAPQDDRPRGAAPIPYPPVAPPPAADPVPVPAPPPVPHDRVPENPPPAPAAPAPEPLTLEPVPGPAH